MRQLATIQQIKSIEPIENSDFLELAHVMGWQCVIKKGEFTPDAWGIYFEIDSFLPLEERYEFLRSSSYRKNQFMGEGFRIKTMRFRGALSQGLFLPLSAFPECAEMPLETKWAANVYLWNFSNRLDRPTPIF